MRRLDLLITKLVILEFIIAVIIHFIQKFSTMDEPEMTTNANQKLNKDDLLPDSQKS